MSWLTNFVGEMGANSRVGVRKNSTGSTFLRRRLNLIEGSGVTLTVDDDEGDEEVDVTISAAGGGSTPTGTGFRHVTSGTEDGAAKLVEIADVASALKPSGTAAGTDESLRRLGTGATHAAAGDDSRFPTGGEKNALAGTSGTPGSGNKYVTDGDARNTDARTPTSHVHSGGDITSGTVVDARIDPPIARDSEVSSAISALSSVYQPLDSDLSSIAALTTTSFGRALLELANQAALLSAAGAAAASHAHSGADITSGTVVDARIDAVIARDAEVAAGYQPLDSDLTSIAALTTTAYGRSLLEAANAAALRTLAALVVGTDVQAFDAELAALAGLTSAADKLPYFTGSGTAGVADFTSAARSLLDDTTVAAMRATLGLADIPWTVVPKTSDESVTGSTTLQSDDELLFATSSGVAYEWEAVIIYTSAVTTSDIKVAWGEDATARGILFGLGFGSADAAAGLAGGSNQSTNWPQGTTAGGLRIAKYWGTHTGAGGTFVCKWAQNTSDVSNATTVKGAAPGSARSVLRYRPVN